MIRNTAFLIVVLAVAVDAFPQIGPPPSLPQGSQAAPLPLSGRSPQGGSVTAIQSAVPGTTTSVNTINPSIQVQGPYAGSTPSTSALPFDGKLSLRDAIERGLRYNLGPVGLNEILRQARGQDKVSRSALLPNITGAVTEVVQQTNLQASGLRINIPIAGFSFPTIVGPFNYIDYRARLTQTIVDLTSLNNYRSTQQTMRAGEFSVEDARDLTVLAAGGAYLQVIAAAARVEAARAQLETANALYKQTAEQRGVGLVAQIDLNRSQVQVLTQQQRLVSLQNDLSKQRINLARITGLPANDQYELTDEISFSAPPPLDLERALKLAFEQRADLKAAEAHTRAAERNRAAARAERLPSLSLSADYGAIGMNPAQSHGTYTVVGTLRLPIWLGGRTEGNIEQAEAAMAQRQAELSDLRARIESDVRNAYLDLQAAASQVDVAEKNVEVTQETLTLTRQKLEAGISDNVAVVQSQDALANAHLDHINSIFAHNVAKLALARAVGGAAESWPRFLSVK
ncbi:MAG: TolC family protein [Acidobacteria bacterium]|nr:MAG: TolC family protein [Acidobacteriota bacterium]